MDIAGLYDSINLSELTQDAVALDFPPHLLELALQVYEGGRTIVGEDLAAPTLWPGRGLIQGCPLAPAISKLSMFFPS